MGIVTLRGGKIWSADHFTENSEKSWEVENAEDLDVCLEDDDLIAPGLYDAHMHLWAPPAQTPFGLADCRHYSTGFVGGLDAGTYGYENWEAANRYWQAASRLQVRSFVSIQPIGLAVFPPKTAVPVQEIEEDKLTAVIAANKGEALGPKVQLGFFHYKSEETDTLQMKLARRVADATGTNMMVHISAQCMDPAASAALMGRNDIITHIYSGFDRTILRENGEVVEAVQAAHKRGVLFDVGHAGKHFAWKTFRSAYEQGIGFDFLGSDMGEGNYRTPTSRIIDQFHELSGFLNYGVGLDEVFRALITNPCRYLGYTPDIDARCLLLRKVAGKTISEDGLGDHIDCSYEYKPVCFIDNKKLIINVIGNK